MTVKKQVEVHYRDSPGWLHKLTAHCRQDTVYEARDAQNCEFCGSTSSVPPPQPSTMGTQERRDVSQTSQVSPGSGADIRLAQLTTAALHQSEGLKFPTDRHHGNVKWSR